MIPTPKEALSPKPQHDLNVDRAEQEITREAFTHLFDDLMLQHIEDVDSYDTRGGTVCNYAILEHESGEPHVEFIDAGEPGEIERASDSYRADQRPRKEVGLQVGGKYGDALTYRLFDDGVVRRYDTTFDDDHESQNATLVADLATNAEALVNHMEGATANLDLEIEMGMNNQPVGLDEIERLRDYLAGLKLRRATSYANRVQYPYGKDRPTLQ